MKLQLVGKGNLPLLTFILDGCSDDNILNLASLARKLECSRSSLLDRIHMYGFDSAVRHYLNEKRKKMIN
ncbi:hypothetical protein [Klebsiella pneumoniae]|uniref:hypothetical protein n=1 Tax=Klebsiella pneumoniae TaxID=573 RepID=UPI0022906047|nr:hypothetical protein [Klebsiella pneumoniae]HCT8859475.1 hypothetical protein [Klebsiella michiganensis]HDT5858001.1 hypothetical protein [Klebsiella quasipneumoniae subsp. similipneumoniae]MDF9957083.1 hypothetical protein [Klebsiella pneumoniae]MDW1355616.1 hypothetical protein [Klebsiella pneumoniae]MDW1415348.1 hypothetical protein [Klebsiella pneumoniae]